MKFEELKKFAMVVFDSLESAAYHDWVSDNAMNLTPNIDALIEDYLKSIEDADF